MAKKKTLPRYEVLEMEQIQHYAEMACGCGFRVVGHSPEGCKRAQEEWDKHVCSEQDDE